MRIVIAGAGVGGLTCALSLHAAGFTDICVYEAARELHEVGVGINLPPHAVRELSELGLAEALDDVGVRTTRLSYYDPAGQLIWPEPRGLEAGYRWPQYSIHRGKLQKLLVDAVRKRLGAKALVTGKRVLQRATRPDGRMNIQVSDVATSNVVADTAHVLIAADGIRSGLRAHFYGAATPLATNGWIMYRGATPRAPFLGGNTMCIVGDETVRVVVYPIGDNLINWLYVRPDDSGNAHELGNWNVEINPADIASHIRNWSFDWLDIYRLVRDSPSAYAYPMADIDPLPRWVFGNCALLGDAAHAMYPFGSNGASQAILDARVLAHHLAIAADIPSALNAYEAQRREPTAQVQLANRRQAGEVMAKVSNLARNNARQQAADELHAIEQRYKQTAGFDIETLNTRPTYSMPPGHVPPVLASLGV